MSFMNVWIFVIHVLPRDGLRRASSGSKCISHRFWRIDPDQMHR